MKRLLVLAPAALTVGAALWFAGLAWPIATQVWSVLAPRSDTADCEADPVG